MERHADGCVVFVLGTMRSRICLYIASDQAPILSTSYPIILFRQKIFSLPKTANENAP